jgi:protein-tyrosine phosphatase
MAAFIEDQSRSGIVYVHCKIGYSRSAAAVAAYLVMSAKADSAEEAFLIMRRVRPSIVIRPEVVTALCELECRLRLTPADPRSFLLASGSVALS